MVDWSGWYNSPGWGYNAVANGPPLVYKLVELQTPIFLILVPKSMMIRILEYL